MSFLITNIEKGRIFWVKINYYQQPAVGSDVNCECSVSWLLAKGSSSPAVPSVYTRARQHIGPDTSDVTKRERGKLPSSHYGVANFDLNLLLSYSDLNFGHICIFQKGNRVQSSFDIEYRIQINSE